MGLVKYECERLFDDVVEKCYDENVFKMPQTKAVLRYVREKHGVAEKYLWEKTPNNAVFREKISGKWFGALLTVKYKTLGVDKDGLCEIIDLKQTAEKIEIMVDNQSFLPGYHMNKKSWYTIILDDRLETEKLFDCIDESYNLIKK